MAKSEVEKLDAATADVLRRVRSAAPGTVVSYNPATGRAQVVMGWVSQTAQGIQGKPPIVPDAPVLWPRAAGCSLAGFLQPGDTGLLVVPSRSIDRWLLAGGSVPLESDRMLQWTDAVFIPGLAPSTTPPPALALAFWYFGTDDGQAYFGVQPDGAAIQLEAATLIRIGAAASHPAILGDNLMAALTAFAADLAASVLIADVIAAGAALVTALAAVPMVSTKVTIE